jgi:hypothetical protein
VGSFSGFSLICPRARERFSRLLILLSIPALSALACMVAGITIHTIYPRLQSRS